MMMTRPLPRTPRQAEKGGRLVIIILHNVPNNIWWTTELKKLTGVCENSCELNLSYPQHVSLQGLNEYGDTY